jgi:hypothetical protein
MDVRSNSCLPSSDGCSFRVCRISYAYGNSRNRGFTLLIVIETVMVLLLRSLYRTRYILTDEELVIKTSKLIGGNKTVPLKTIDSVEATPIPCGIRLFGASFHGGYYQVQDIGRTFQSITNYHDGLLIRTKNKNYIITPKDRMKFKEEIETKRRV